MTFRVQPAIVTRICDGCRAESDPVDLPVLREQGWTLAPGGPYDHPVPALDWCPNCTTIRSDLAAAIALVRELHHPSQSTIWSHDLQQAITVTTCHCGSEQYPCPTIKAIDGERDE